MKKILLFLVLSLFYLSAQGIQAVEKDPGLCPPRGANPSCNMGYCNFGYCTSNTAGARCTGANVCMGDYVASAEYCKYSDSFYYGVSGRTCSFDTRACKTYKDSKKYGLCTQAKDCVTCPASKPDYPYKKCDYNTKECKLVYECGKNECTDFKSCCNKKTDANGKKLTFPYYICTNKLVKDIWGQEYSYGNCAEQKDCGINQCNPYLDPTREFSIILQSSGRKVWIESYIKCEVPYSCDYSTGRCVIDKSGKYTALYDCERWCYQKVTTTTRSTTTTKPATTTTTKGAVTPLPEPIKPTPGTSTTTTTTTKPAVIPDACRINYFSWSKYAKGSNLIYTSYNSYTLFSKPEDNILDNPKLEYTASSCGSCELEVVPFGVTKYPTAFIENETNKDAFGELPYTEELSENRYLFDRSAFNQNGIIFDVTDLLTGSYIFKLSCTDPGTGEVQEETVKLNVFPTFRWREVKPVLN